MKRTILLTLYVLLGLVAIGALRPAGPLVVGAGTLRRAVESIETFDWSPVLLLAAAVLWAAPLAGWWLASRARVSRGDVASLERIARKILAEGVVPVKVRVDQVLPIELDREIAVPFEVATRVGIAQDLEFDATIPVRAEIPIDVEVPIRSRVKVEARDIPVEIREVARVTLPSLSVPVRGTLEAEVVLPRIGT